MCGFPNIKIVFIIHESTNIKNENLKYALIIWMLEYKLDAQLNILTIISTFWKYILS